MFGDLFGVTPSEVNESNKALAIANAAIAVALIEKGIITDADLEKAHIKATSLIDQIWAENREQAKSKFDEQHPGLRDFLKKYTEVNP